MTTMTGRLIRKSLRKPTTEKNIRLLWNKEYVGKQFALNGSVNKRSGDTTNLDLLNYRKHPFYYDNSSERPNTLKGFNMSDENGNIACHASKFRHAKICYYLLPYIIYQLLS